MDNKKNQNKVQSKSNPVINFNMSEVEKRLEILEKLSHKSCGEVQTAKVDLSNLPQLPDKKTTTLEKRVSAIEELIQQLIDRLQK